MATFRLPSRDPHCGDKTIWLQSSCLLQGIGWEEFQMSENPRKINITR